MIRFARHCTALLLLALAAVAPVHAAESYDNCTGFIDSVPVVITTQGTWCLRGDIVTAISTGTAISINTNNVTIDCNDFKIGGLQAGAGTQAIGISANDVRFNATVRRCGIRGFYAGVLLTGNGILIEDNRFDGNTAFAIFVQEDGNTIRRNRIFDTGGSTLGTTQAIAIFAYNAADISDNIISGVNSLESDTIGIQTTQSDKASITRNNIRGVVTTAINTKSAAIFNFNSGRIAVVGNQLFGDSQLGSSGVECSDNAGIAKDNIARGYATNIKNCTDAGGNVVAP